MHQQNKSHQQKPERACLTGLTEDEANARLAQEGPNQLASDGKRSAFSIAADVLREPMLALLLAAAVIYLLLGDLGEALILMLFATMSVGITFYQEFKTERVLETLKNLTGTQAIVIRDGQRRKIAATQLVRGDLIEIGEGERVPADALLRTSHDLQADEALLTGESVPVSKFVVAQNDAETSDRQGFVYSGTMIVRGSGICEVTATGPRSELGKVGQSLSGISEDRPRMAAEIYRLVRIFAVLGAAASLSAVLLYGLIYDDWLQGLLSGIALGMSMLPEEFPVVLTVFMAMGAWRISKVKVLTRRASAIEALGSATILCTDKTGTLTQNRMSIVSLVLADGTAFDLSDSSELPNGDFTHILGRGILACSVNPFDPMEIAFHDHAETVFPDGHPGENGWTLAQEYGLRRDLLAVTQVWDTRDEEKISLVVAKGAPEAILQLCKIEGAMAKRILQQATDMARRGQRVLGIAEAGHSGADWPETPHGFDFSFLGLTGLADPLREQVPESIALCQSAGLRVVMITGDYPETALAIARNAGIKGDDVVTGAMLGELDDAALTQRIRSANVFARIMPEQKLRIVNAFKAAGEIVAMTGDGVNDAPSLKAAHIGIAMGKRGTDVAREASSIVLMEDDFTAIPAAIKLGRRIYDNMRKAAIFIFAIHIPIAGLALLPLVFGMPFIVGPIHIALLELAIDPTCSLVFEAEREERDIMRRPPRSPRARLLPRRLAAFAFLQGISALLLSSGVYLFGLHGGLPAEEVRSLTFVVLVLSILAIVLTNRTFSASLRSELTRPNSALLGVAGLVGLITALALVWPAFTRLLDFAPLTLQQYGIAAASFVLFFAALTAAKMLRFRLG
ncbi:cation-translocating P-type ATPase [Rhizobium sp. L1K21]|uniref:cation-translocating P-type ATPase n=1 Tax=Rhizobium sp. L1K21 TaxID=2954933 RepID=UPI0020940128|nr:cation-translocating P-type ATPase [Rhizobium sp. L1K21]MCO6186887.1 cation-translocating P-type ATPase [Rhizobium sp. L1K21]